MIVGDKVINKEWPGVWGFIEGINGDVACVTWSDVNKPNFVPISSLKLKGQHEL